MRGRYVLRWVPFVLIFAGLASLAETKVLRDAFLRQYGPVAWDNLHWYGSAVLLFAAYVAQSRRSPVWRRLAVAAALVLTAGLLRELRQYSSDQARLSVYDLKSNLRGATVGVVASLIWTVASRYGRRRGF